MSIIYKKHTVNGDRVAAWKITEPEEFFIDNLQWTNDEKSILDKLRNRRRIEWLSSRYLICQLCNLPDSSYIRKNKFGKPTIKDSNLHISLSHSHDMVAAIVSDKDVGVDIQKYVSKINRIAHKYLNMEELHSIPEKHMIDAFHIIWGAKECLYKAYGRKRISYMDHIRIDISNLLKHKVLPDHLRFTGYISTPEFFENYNLRLIKLNNYFLTYCKVA